MSFMRPVLNQYLRWTERPHLERVRDQDKLRSSFETKARFFFHGPSAVKARETTIGGRPALDLASDQSARVILYFHGGGYVFGSPRTHSAMLQWICRASGARAIMPDYRKAPEHPFPAAVDDALAAYVGLLDEGVDPARIVLGGDSAGGGLALVLLSRILQDRHPKPAGLFAFSPLTDLSCSGASMSSNAANDVMLPASRVLEMTQAYVDEKDRRNPDASPLYAVFSEAPPVWLRAGDTEILLDDTVRMAAVLEAANVRCDLKIEHDLPHVWPIFHNTLPEARATLRELAGWVRQQTSQPDGN